MFSLSRPYQIFTVSAVSQKTKDITPQPASQEPRFARKNIVAGVFHVLLHVQAKAVTTTLANPHPSQRPCTICAEQPSVLCGMLCHPLARIGGALRGHPAVWGCFPMSLRETGGWGYDGRFGCCFEALIMVPLVLLSAVQPCRSLSTTLRGGPQRRAHRGGREQLPIQRAPSW